MKQPKSLDVRSARCVTTLLEDWERPGKNLGYKHEEDGMFCTRLGRSLNGKSEVLPTRFLGTHYIEGRVVGLDKD